MRLMSSFKLKTRSLHYLLNLIVAYAILQMPAYADGYQYHGNSIELTAASGIQNSYSYEFRYRDRIEIKSLPNQTFEYDARSTVNGFHAFIDRNVPLSDVAYKNHFNTTSSIDRNLAVGKTNASYSVTPTGAFIYQIPIFTSPGTNGIQPQISIVYNSQGGNGELGFGFGLSGLSAISRVPKNFYFDNESGGVDFSSNDRFALDGQRLILLSNGNYGDPSTSYGSEVENFSQITTWNTNYGNLTNNPFCFTVITKDGKTIEYGKTVDSRITAGNSDYVICWKINKITDANGNYMIFNYNNSSGANGESWLKSIEYTGNTNSNILPYNKIEFFYDKRKDINQSFIAGYSIPQTVLLTKVVVSAENQLVKTYDLNYYLNHYSQLVSVQETGADGQKLNPIEIKWTENLSDLSYDDISRTANDFPVAEDNSNLQVSDYNGIIYGDFNGDSKTDYIVLDENLQTWKIYSNANGSYSDYTLKNSGSLADIVRKYEHQFRHKIIYANSFASDVDNDGKTDLILCLLENDENQDQNGEWIGDWHPQGYAYLILFNIGTNTDPFQFSFQDHVNTPTINRSATYQDKRMVVGNFLGTKHFQIFIYNENGDKGNLLVYDEQYRCFNSINYNPDLNLPSEFSQLHIEDNPNKNPMTSGNFLGKGKTELLLDVYGVDNLQNSYNKFVVYSINLNGGNLELVRKFEDNRTLIHKKVLFGDFNGDGKTDILALTNHLSWGVSEDAVNIWKIYFGKGTGFDEVAASSLHLYLNAENPATNICNNNYIIQTGDFNGDGKTDVVQITKQSFGVDRYIHLSYGYGFKTIGENLTSSYFDSFRVNSFSFIGDINGDGNLDLILEYDELCANFYENNTRHIFSSIILKDEESQHVSKIFDGLENYTEIKYDLMNRISLTFPHLMSNNILEASYPMYLVTNVKEYYGYFISTTENQYPINYSYSKIDYTYSTPCFHQLGKGFLGFAENTSYTHIFDENNTSIFSRYTSSQNQLNTDYTVLLPTYKAEKINPQSEPLNTASTSYSFINLPNNRYFIKSSNEVLDYFNYSKKTSNINYYDESAPTQFFGNVSSQEEEYSKLSCQAGYFDVNDNWHDPVWSSVPYAHSIVNYNAYMKPANFLYPSFPSVVVQTKKFVDHTTESDYSRKLSMEYYDNGNLKTKISDPDFQDLTVKTEYVYNNFGNIISQTLSAPSAQPSKKPLHRTITSQYDTYGRFELIKTDAAGVSIKGFYDPKFGQVTFKYDPNNLVTQYFYDGFGRNIKTISADGAESSQEISFIPLNGIVSINSFLPLTQIIKRATNAPEQVTYFDSKGRDLSTVTTGYDNKPVAVDKFYDKLGRQNKTTEPYFKIPNPPSMYHTPNVIPNVISYSLNEYDEFGRVIRKNFNTYDHENSSTTILQTQFSYNNAEYSITTTLPDGLTSKIVKDILGNTIKTYDTKNSEKNFVEHAYYNSGKVRRSTVNNINGELSHVDFEYDLQGNQTKLIDQDAGTTSYEYDAFGQLILQTNARNLTFQLQYDVLGRVTKKYWPIENGTYPETNYYYVASGPGIGLLQSVIAPNQASTAYQYDIYGRQIQIDERVPDGANFASFSTKYEYRDHGREKLITYPSGLKIFSSNNANTGLLDFINLGDNSSNKIYLVTEIDNLGRINRANLKSILNFEKKYDDFGFLREISTAPFAGGNPIQYENYVYNIYNGDLISRNLDPLQIPSKNETFVYDNLDRLITITYGVTTQTVDYHDNGNILSKGGIGTYSYNIVNKTHAVSGIDDGNNTSQISQETQNIQYTSFDKISSISEGMNSAEFIYGTDNERRLMTTTRSGAVTKRFYCGSYEKEVNVATGNIKEIHYLTAPTGLFAVYIKETNQPDLLYYVQTDRQGSIVGLQKVQENGTTTEAARFSYDAWGRMRNPIDWSDYTVTTTLDIIPRGYTGHEHLTDFALINMNGRLYDPALGRFLSTDNYVQSPDNPQNYNRYTYCLNNPLKYTDPSGNCFFIPVIIAMTIAACADITYQSFKTGNVDFNHVLRTAAIAGLTACVGGGLAAFAPGGILSGGFYGAGAGIITNGVSNSLNGKYFFDSWGYSAAIGFAAGALNGYYKADAAGKNMFWGSKIAKNRDEWSIWNEDRWDTDVSKLARQTNGSRIPFPYSCNGTSTNHPHGICFFCSLNDASRTLYGEGLSFNDWETNLNYGTEGNLIIDDGVVKDVTGMYSSGTQWHTNGEDYILKSFGTAEEYSASQDGLIGIGNRIEQGLGQGNCVVFAMNDHQVLVQSISFGFDGSYCLQVVNSNSVSGLQTISYDDIINGKGKIGFILGK